MIDFESQSSRTLLVLAGGRNGIDAARCSLVFTHLGTAERLRCCLRSALARHQLSELQFAILVLLFEVEPEPIPMAVLANYSGVSRPAVTDALDSLEASGLATRARDRRDRRIIHGRITAVGREKIDKAIDDYLNVTTQTAGCVEELEQQETRTRSANSEKREHSSVANFANEPDTQLSTHASELVEIATIWPGLSCEIRTAVLTLIRVSKRDAT